MEEKSYWINKLNLQAHPEGGYFKETYRSEGKSNFEGFSDKRNLSTGIYFLLDGHNFSAFHRIKSDEMWHFYSGGPLLIHMISDQGEYFSQKIGKDFEAGELLQFVVPANWWFASEVVDKSGFSLVGCTVAPGFDFEDFELADESLIEDFPKYGKLIRRLLR